MKSGSESTGGSSDTTFLNAQVLFVDRSDTIRARSAAGLFEVVCHWNCMDMVLVQDRCGVDVEPGGYMGPWDSYVSCVPVARRWHFFQVGRGLADAGR